MDRRTDVNDLRIKRRTVHFTKNAGNFSNRCKSDRIANCEDIVKEARYLVKKCVTRYAASEGRIQSTPKTVRVKAAGLLLSECWDGGFERR
jgi:hypothetical protein